MLLFTAGSASYCFPILPSTNCAQYLSGNNIGASLGLLDCQYCAVNATYASVVKAISASMVGYYQLPLSLCMPL